MNGDTGGQRALKTQMLLNAIEFLVSQSYYKLPNFRLKINLRLGLGLKMRLGIRVKFPNGLAK